MSTQRVAVVSAALCLPKNDMFDLAMLHLNKTSPDLLQDMTFFFPFSQQQICCTASRFTTDTLQGILCEYDEAATIGDSSANDAATHLARVTGLRAANH